MPAYCRFTHSEAVVQPANQSTSLEVQYCSITGPTYTMVQQWMLVPFKWMPIMHDVQCILYRKVTINCTGPVKCISNLTFQITIFESLGNAGWNSEAYHSFVLTLRQQDLLDVQYTLSCLTPFLVYHQIYALMAYRWILAFVVGCNKEWRISWPPLKQPFVGWLQLHFRQYWFVIKQSNFCRWNYDNLGIIDFLTVLDDHPIID